MGCPSYIVHRFRWFIHEQKRSGVTLTLLRNPNLRKEMLDHKLEVQKTKVLYS